MRRLFVISERAEQPAEHELLGLGQELIEIGGQLITEANDLYNEEGSLVAQGRFLIEFGLYVVSLGRYLTEEAEQLAQIPGQHVVPLAPAIEAHDRHAWEPLTPPPPLPPRLRRFLEDNDVEWLHRGD